MRVCRSNVAIKNTDVEVRTAEVRSRTSQNVYKFFQVVLYGTSPIVLPRWICLQNGIREGGVLGVSIKGNHS